MSNWSWVTQSMFDEELEDIVDDMSTAALLAYEGVYECFAEQLNNDILRRLAEKHGADEETGILHQEDDQGNPLSE